MLHIPLTGLPRLRRSAYATERLLDLDTVSVLGLQRGDKNEPRSSVLQDFGG
jgi:hypothetical protein